MEINLKGKYVLVVCPNPSIDIFAWVDNFKMGEPNRIIKEEKYPGGKGIHVAMALAETDVEVVVVGFWGAMAGAWIKKECHKYYPKIRFEGPMVKEWSRTCYTFKEETSDGFFDDTEILGTGPTLNEEDIKAFWGDIKRLMPGAKACVLSGSWPKNSPEDAYERIIRISQGQQVPSFLDCTGAQLENALAARPYCVHLNRSEISTYFNSSNFEEVKAKMLDLCTVAAITDGANGLYYINTEKEIHSLATVENVVSTIGSGDCLLAGIVAGHLNNLSTTAIAKLGAAYGAANCVRKELGMLYKKDINNLFEAAQVLHRPEAGGDRHQ